MRKAVLVAALTAAVSMVVPASAGAWAAGPLPTQAVQGGPGDTREQKAGDDGLAVIGLTSGQRLVEFRTGAPSEPWQLGKVSGLKKDTKLVGIDFRVQNAKLYGVGDKGGIYTLNTRNAKATKVSQLTVAPAGNFFESTSTRRRTGCVSSATPARICATTSTTRRPRAPRPSTAR